MTVQPMGFLIGQRVRQLRLTHRDGEKVGLSRSELARRSGVGVKTLSNLERSKIRYPQDVTVARIAQALGVDLDEIEEVRRGEVKTE